MLAFRLVFLIVMVAGLLTAIAVSSSDRNARDGRTSTDPLPRATLAATETVEAKLPHDGPIEARVGDMLVLRFTPQRSEVVELDAFGFEQGVAGGVPTVVRIVAARPGTFDLRLRRAEKTLAKLKVAPRQPLSGGTAAG